MSGPIEHQLQATFAALQARAFMHVQDLDTGHAVSVDDDAPVSAASVIKIVFCLAFARQVSAGALDPAARAEVPGALRVGGTGTTGFQDRVALSLRDLALSMMTVSDNAATDVVVAHTGRPPIDAVLTDLGLSATHVRGDMMWGHMGVVRALGLPTPLHLDDQLEAADEAAVRSLALLDPQRANASTARDVGSLLNAIWTDGAGPPDACAFVRGAMAQQVTRQRLASGFDQAGVRVAAKSGTLPGVRNEAGVVTYPDGRRYSAAIFTRAESLRPNQPLIDAAIGDAARRAIEHLRQAG